MDREQSKENKMFIIDNRETIKWVQGNQWLEKIVQENDLL